MKNYFLMPIFFLVGCTTKMSKFEPVIDIAPKQWESTADYASDSNVTYWVETFQDNNLSEAIRTAWKRNPDLLSIAENVLARGEDAVIAGANLFPAARADLAGSRSKRNLIGFNFPGGETSFTTKTFSSGINISWEVDLWGRLSNLRNSVRKDFEGTQAEYEAARLSLAGLVAKSWFGIAESSAQLAILSKTTQTYSKNQAFVNDRYEKGLANALETNLALSILADSRANLSKGRRFHESNLRSLTLLTGTYPSVNSDWNTSQTVPLLSLPAPPSTPVQVLEQRPDLRAARLKMEASGLMLNASKKNFLPAFTIIGGSGSTADEFNDILSNRFRTWNLSGSISQPIFQGGRLMAQTRKAKAIQKGMIEKYRSSILTAFAEVENALSAEKLLTQEESSLQLAVQASSSAAKISWDRYQRGVENIFNALENQSRAFDAERRLLFTKKEKIYNRINLFLALGLSPLPEIR
jgi:NodT family efflux transporter outer membrane factor (OMF) lipoprotein